MTEVIIARNSVDPSTWEHFDTDNVCDLLVREFKEWPKTARIYNEYVAQVCDVTPYDEASIERLNKLEGPIYAVVFPHDPVTIITGIVISLALSAVSYLLAPKVAEPPAAAAARNVQATSPNNALTARQNSARVNARIPDIFGTVRSTPDLIALPYSTFEGNKEVEFSYMCIGRGSFDVSDILDDTTSLSDIAGSSVAIYAPDTSPNTGDAPQTLVGDAITEPVINAVRSNVVDGQVLLAPNSGTFKGHNDTRFVYPDTIQTQKEDMDFTDLFGAGDTIVVVVGNNHGLNLSGTYLVTDVEQDTITLSSPELVNADWTAVGLLTDGATDYISPNITSTNDHWIGPFILSDIDKVYANFVAVQGMYKDDGSSQSGTNVELQLEVTPVDVHNIPIGAAETLNGTIIGSSTVHDQRAITLKFQPSFTGRVSVRAKRVTNKDFAFSGQVVDEVKWRDLYAVKDVGEVAFGNVTTVHAKTIATFGALAVKSRKLNMLVSRKIQLRVSGTTFSDTLTATDRADEIIAAICLDPFIGRRSIAELDVDNIYDTIAEVLDYFGVPEAINFNYTFDASNVSFEEILAIVASSNFCTSYRRGNKIKLSFEKRTEDSTLLFNHRNKLPGSETRTVTFGRQNDYDGIELNYVDPVDDAIVTIYIPTDQSASNAKKIETVGIRSYTKAHFHAWRAWNKIQYQRVATTFTATQEADLAVLQDRVLVADNTRSGTQDGQITAQNITEVTLSQKVTLDPLKTYTMFVQNIDGSVEAIAIESQSSDNSVILSDVPTLPLSVDAANYAKATYLIVADDDPREKAFLVSEKIPQSNFTLQMTAINYDDKYYANDIDAWATVDSDLILVDSDVVRVDRVAT